MTTQIEATFHNARLAKEAHDWLLDTGVQPEEMSMSVGPPALAQEKAREGRMLVRIVLTIAGASILGTGIGAALGATLAAIVGPEGESGLIIQVVSWAIFAHLLIGMWAGYILLADRSERELGRTRPVLLTVRCDTINANTVADQLRGLEATVVRTIERQGAR